jgi:nitrogen fixation-related uncharacterized protein
MVMIGWFMELPDWIKDIIISICAVIVAVYFCVWHFGPGVFEDKKMPIENLRQPADDLEQMDKLPPADDLEQMDKLPPCAICLQGHVTRAIERRDAMRARQAQRKTAIVRGPCAYLDLDGETCNEPTGEKTKCTDSQNCSQYEAANCPSCRSRSHG